MVHPKAVASPTSILVEGAVSARIRQMFATSAIISAGVLRTLARLWAGLTETGIPILWTPAPMASRAPRRFGTKAATESPGSVRANATTSAASAICGRSWGGTNEPTSISRTPAACSAAIHRHLSAVAITTSRFCRPSRNPTSTTSTATASIGFLRRRIASEAHHKGLSSPRPCARLRSVSAAGLTRGAPAPCRHDGRHAGSSLYAALAHVRAYHRLETKIIGEAHGSILRGDDRGPYRSFAVLRGCSLAHHAHLVGGMVRIL